MTREPANYVAEWFGHVVWPPGEVVDSEAAADDQRKERCPFLTAAVGRETLCIKTSGPKESQFRTGFCTQSSDSTGSRLDWLACPARVFDESFTLVREAIRCVFGLAVVEQFLAVPITRVWAPEVLREAGQRERSGEGRRVFAFASNPPSLGGEIDMPETAHSPGSKVDISIFEIEGFTKDQRPKLGRFCIFEVQTADFHGSPLHAIEQLRKLGPPSMKAAYHDGIRSNPHSLGSRVEGPNKANIFKRTIYQMVFKIQMAKDPKCAGFCVVLPEPVWESWQRHLGSPLVKPIPGSAGVSRLVVRLAAGVTALVGDETAPIEVEPAWIIVFRIDRGSAKSPKPLVVTQRIATDSATLLRLAFDTAPERAIAEGVVQKYAETFAERILRFRPK